MSWWWSALDVLEVAVGVVAGGLINWWFSRRSSRELRREADALRKETEKLRRHTSGTLTVGDEDDAPADREQR